MLRVTQVLDYLTEPELLSWMLRTSKAKRDAIKDEACSIGTEVDKLVQMDILGEPLPHSYEKEAVANCMKAWDAFKRDYPWFKEAVFAMQTELSDGKVMGHPDFILHRDGNWGISDLKTSSSIRPRYWTQVAQYSEMWKPKAPPLPRFVSVLRLDKKTAGYEYVEITDENAIAYEVEVFNAYLLAYHHNFENRENIRRALEADLLEGGK